MLNLHLTPPPPHELPNRIRFGKRTEGGGPKFVKPRGVAGLPSIGHSAWTARSVLPSESSDSQMLGGAGDYDIHHYHPNQRDKKSLLADLAGPSSQSLRPATGRPGKELPALPTSPRTLAEGTTHPGGLQEPGWRALTLERAGKELGVRDTGTHPAAAPSALCPAPDRVSGEGALYRGRPPQPAADKALGCGATPGRRPRTKLARLGGQGDPAGGLARH